MIILVILGLIAFVIFLILFIKYKVFKSYLLSCFKYGNVIVYGKKRKGKDLLFQYVINQRDDYYYANIPYGNEYELIPLTEVSVYPNTYDNFVNENLKEIERRFYDTKDIYISDVGNFLPSNMDTQLHKRYPSMPILYSLSGHLYANNIHCNSQNLDRVWKALREQADTYICINKRTIKLFGCIFITRMIVYDKYETAKNNILPMKKRLLNKYSKALYDDFQAKNGNITKGYIIQFKKDLHYDTRYFEKLVFKDKPRKIFGEEVEEVSQADVKVVENPSTNENN